MEVELEMEVNGIITQTTINDNNVAHIRNNIIIFIVVIANIKDSLGYRLWVMFL